MYTSTDTDTGFQSFHFLNRLQRAQCWKGLTRLVSLAQPLVAWRKVNCWVYKAWFFQWDPLCIVSPREACYVRRIGYFKTEFLPLLINYSSEHFITKQFLIYKMCKLGFIRGFLLIYWLFWLFEWCMLNGTCHIDLFDSVEHAFGNG